MRDRLDIAVLGCGTAGAAAALFLSREGHNVTLVERVHHPGPVGAGIVMQPSGLSILSHLGLVEAIVASGARLEGLRCRGPRHTLFALRYERLAAGAFGLGLHRGVLFEALHGALRGSGIELEFGRAAERLEAYGDRHFVRLDGAGRLGPFDLVVIADGARSRMRAEVAPRAFVRRYPYGALWFIGEIGDKETPELVQAVEGTRRMVGLLPTGIGPGGGRTRLGSLFYSLPEAEVTTLRRSSIQCWKANIRSSLPEASALLQHIHDWDQLLFAAYHDVVLPEWHDRGVVLIGDAAHATSPQLGQGCNLALVDAHFLADSIATQNSLPDALAAYSRARRPVLDFYQRASRWLTPLFQSDDVAFGPLRDVAFPLASLVPYFERRMLETMAGCSTGLFSAGPLAYPPDRIS